MTIYAAVQQRYPEGTLVTATNGRRGIVEGVVEDEDGHGRLTVRLLETDRYPTTVGTYHPGCVDIVPEGYEGCPNGGCEG